MPAALGIEFGEEVIEQDHRPLAGFRVQERNLGEFQGERREPLFAARAVGGEGMVAAQEGEIVAVGSDHRYRLGLFAGRLFDEGGGKGCLDFSQPRLG